MLAKRLKTSMAHYKKGNYPAAIRSLELMESYMNKDDVVIHNQAEIEKTVAKLKTSIKKKMESS